ncbi:MAG: pyridoxal phosphate-dependent aminotransferase [bacterium JZ-2024 1]
MVLAQARALEAQGKHIIHLEIGEPDFDTPQHIKDACIRAISSREYTHYTPSVGIMKVREAVARYVQRTRGVKVSPEEVVIGPGAKPIIFASIVSLVDIGDEVIIPMPAYPAYESVTRFVGGIPIPVPLREENDFSLDLEELRKKITPLTKLLILNYPQNPTGGTLPYDDLKEIASLVVEHNFWVLADEIYSRIIYEGHHHSLIAFPGVKERMVLVDGLSKTYAMTGWRLGFGVMPTELVEKVGLVLNNVVSCTAAFVQISTIEALEGPQEPSEKMVEEFRRRRDVIVDGVNRIPGFACRVPKGAFYVFPNVRALGWPSKKLANYFLHHAGVALLSGTDFGLLGEGYLRLSYANSVENIQEALARIDKAVKNLPKE